MSVVNLEEKFSRFEEYWSPKIIGELNGQLIKIAKIKGEFIWHKHEHEDEFFMVVKGKIEIKLPENDVQINEGEFFIVPRGVEHKPVAEKEAHIMMFEPATTVNTGNITSERTVDKPQKI